MPQRRGGILSSLPGKGPMRVIAHRSGITAALHWHRTPATGVLTFLFLFFISLTNERQMKNSRVLSHPTV